MYPAPFAARLGAVALALLLFFGILTIWVPERWPLGVLQAGMFLLGAAWSLRQAVKREKLRWAFPVLVATGIAAWGLLQLGLGWTVYRLATWESVLTWATYAVVCWLASELLAWWDLRRDFRHALMWFGFLLSVASTVFYFAAPGKIFGIFPVDYRAVGPFLNRDHYSTFVELIVPLALWEGLIDRRRTWSRALMAAALLASVVAGASRAGSILVTLQVLLMLFLGLRPRLAETGVLRQAIAWTVLFAVAFVVVVGWEVLWRRFQEPDPFRGRREMLLASLAMVRERPGTGFGLGTWPVAYPAYAIWDPGTEFFVNHAHNDWAEWAADGGLPVAGAMLALGLWSFRQGLSAPWGLGVVAALAHCAVDFPMQRPALAACLFAVVGALAARRVRRRD